VGVGYSVCGVGVGGGGAIATKKRQKNAKYCRNQHPPPMLKYGFPTWIGGAIPYHNPTTTII